MKLLIILIKKPKSDDVENPHMTITHFGWIASPSRISDISSEEFMVKWIKNGGFNRVLVKDPDGNEIPCVVREKNGKEYIQAMNRGILTDDLLSLPNFDE